MKSFLTLVLSSSLLLSGCGSGQAAGQPGEALGTQDALFPSKSMGALIGNNGWSDEPLITQRVVSSQNNEWAKACATYRPLSSKGYGAAYNAVIADVCAKAKPNSFKASAIVAPSVSARNLSRYMGSLRFHESYWGSRMNPTFQSPLRIVFSEKDRNWWTQKQKQYLIKPDLGWFTSKSEGSHCRVMPDIFCPKHFEGALTKSGAPIEFRIIGSKLNWQDWQITNGAHEAVHIYQDSHSQSHWSFWYIEGQATFFELAMARLLNKSDSLRKKYLVDNPRQQDSLRFSAKSAQSVAKYFDDCNNSGDACASFKYGGGSLFHEKLILDYGLEKYFKWQDYLNLNMPRGDLSLFTPAENEKLYSTFAKSFEVVFGISQERFEKNVMPQYFVDSFRASRR